MQKILSLFMAMLMAASLCAGALPVAAESETTAESGLCEHHPAHTQDCGYAPGQAAQPCTHVHDERCGMATPENACTHIHDETCGYREATPQSPCTYAENGCPQCAAEQAAADDRLQTTGDVEEGDTVQTSENAVEAEESTAEEAPAAAAYSAQPLAEPAFPEHVVSGVSPSGTTIDLFDYWITGKYDSDIGSNTSTGFLSKGINNGHALLFGNGMNNNTNAIGLWNRWTGNETPRSGIVQNTLGEDGYPKMNVNIGDAGDLTTNDGTQSLAYLFDPGFSCDGKDSYRDVRGLLQVDEQGYYYYDSKKNYAVYDEGDNAFVLYEYPGVLPGGSSPVGQFFPFNAATADAKTVTYKEQSYTLMNTVTSTNSSLNHYFGLHMSTRFIQQDGGYIGTGSNRVPVTYEFSGDDDVWIFIDGVLVADLGGIHDMASVKIDFSTGIITINDIVQSKTLGELLGNSAGTLPDNTYHTLEFFYLERGNVDSNMSLKYNLVTIPESSLIKVDQMGDPVPGTEFTLYEADDYERNGEKAKPIATGRTDANGEFVFLDEWDFPITIEKLYNKYGESKDTNENNLILCESYTPPGYRTCGPIGLYFDRSVGEEVMLLSNSVWTEGAYAMPKVTTTAPNVIRSAENPENTVTLTGTDAVENPLLFAVVYQKVKNADGTFATDAGGNYLWRPVSGDPLNGWKVEADSSWNSVLAAAKASPYLFRLASSGAYQVEISNLPGDIRNYYHICQNEEEAEYTVGYYYSTAPSLDAATAENTWRIDSDPPAGAENYALSRVFSLDLYVSNIKNQLLVQKVDETGQPVTGAEFSLYRASDVTSNGDGTITVPEGTTAYDRVTTGVTAGVLALEGGGSFPAQRDLLEKGEYYLVETQTPGGYIGNETAVHVIIDDTGVYADAGTDKDGVTVLRGVGSIMRSMLQFAVDDDVNTTLQGIQAALATSVQYNGTGFTWQNANWGNTSQVLHLQYANANKMLDYGLYDQTLPATVDNLTLATEAGWSRLLIRQCYQHDGSVNTAIKENLGTQDITGLFSGTVTVRVENQRIGNLKVSKTVTGNGAPAGATFNFTLNLVYEGVPLSGTYQTVDQAGNKRTIQFKNGSATLMLQAAQSRTILGLPTGAVYTVTESTPPTGFGVTAAVTGDDSVTVTGAMVQGTIPHHKTDTETVTLAYTNNFDGKTRARLTGVKTLQGRSIQAEETFTFAMEPKDDVTIQAVAAGDVLLPANGTATATGNGTATAEFLFEEITFLEEGEYLFLIREVLPADTTESAPVSGGIWYDTHIATATVTVTRNETTGLLAAAVTYDNSAAFSPADKEETDKAAFTNAAATLTLTKTVSGSMGDRDQKFQFNIALRDSEGNPLTGSFHYTETTAERTTFAELSPGPDGTANVYLAHGQSITVYGLPPGGTYTITEPGAQQDGYTVQYAINGATPTAGDTAQGTLNESNTLVVYENNRESPVATGIALEEQPWLLAGALSLAGGAALVWGERRKHRRRKAGKGVAGHKD